MRNEPKHTALPWVINTNSSCAIDGAEDLEGHGINRRLVANAGGFSRNYGPDNVLETNQANTAFIVEACNSHYELKARVAEAEKLIKKMLVALQNSLGSIERITRKEGWDHDPYGEVIAKGKLEVFHAQAFLSPSNEPKPDKPEPSETISCTNCGASGTDIGGICKDCGCGPCCCSCKEEKDLGASYE